MYFLRSTLVVTATPPRVLCRPQVSAIVLVGQAHSWSPHFLNRNKRNLPRMRTNYLQNLFPDLGVDLLIEFPLTSLRMASLANDPLQSMCNSFTRFTPLFVSSFHFSEWPCSQNFSFRPIFLPYSLFGLSLWFLWSSVSTADDRWLPMVRQRARLLDVRWRAWE